MNEERFRWTDNFSCFRFQIMYDLHTYFCDEIDDFCVEISLFDYSFCDIF